MVVGPAETMRRRFLGLGFALTTPSCCNSEAFVTTLTIRCIDLRNHVDFTGATPERYYDMGV